MKTAKEKLFLNKKKRQRKARTGGKGRERILYSKILGESDSLVGEGSKNFSQQRNTRIQTRVGRELSTFYKGGIQGGKICGKRGGGEKGSSFQQMAAAVNEGGDK